MNPNPFRKNAALPDHDVTVTYKREMDDQTAISRVFIAGFVCSLIAILGGYSITGYFGYRTAIVNCAAVAEHKPVSP